MYNIHVKWLFAFSELHDLENHENMETAASILEFI